MLKAVKMIIVKSKHDVEKMQKACTITANALHYGGKSIKVGMSTYELDKLIHDYIVKNGAKPSFLGYGGFPGSACISINDEVIHGIPSKDRVLKEGDIVKVDVGAYIGGFHGDSANTFGVGKISEDAQRLIDVTKKAFEIGVAAITTDGGRIGDIGAAIDAYVRENGCSTVKKYVGHGIGADLHEDPNVPNFGTKGRGPRLCRGMVIAIEPMINLGGDAVLERPDHWTVVTKDGSLSAHYEHTVALTADGPLLLTKVD